jgi:hypothetical protein
VYPHGENQPCFVKKKDGTLRLCIDYRKLNKMTINNKYHFPMIDDLFYYLRGVVVFTRTEVRLGYHLVNIKDEDIQKKNFRTRYGLYDFVVIPFWLTNAPTTFMLLMNSFLNKYIDKFVLVFLDDILLYSKTTEEHEEHIRMVLKVMRENQLYANLNKCDLFQE